MVHNIHHIQTLCPYWIIRLSKSKNEIFTSYVEEKIKNKEYLYHLTCKFHASKELPKKLSSLSVEKMNN